MPKCSNLTSFWKPEAFGQTVLPDRPVLIWQKLVKMPKFKNSNATFWVLFKHCIRYAIINFDLQCNCWLLSSRDDKSIARWSKAIFSRQKIGQSPRRRKCEFMRSLTATCQVMRQTKRPCSSDYQKCNEDKH